MRTQRHAVLIALLVTASSTTPLDRSSLSTVAACGPITTFPVFTPLYSPEQPDFVTGNLGILQPTYARRYLLAAWRVLNERPLTAEEQQVFNGSGPTGQFTVRRASDTWQEVRKTVAEIAAPMVAQDTFILPTYSYIVNCSDSALITAANTLEARRLALGAASAPFLDWVRAQDLVFSNCGRRNKPAVIPDPLGADATPEARADRDYQIAAAHFYAGQFADAEARFLAIANDGASPWQPWGRYLAARAAIRQGTMGGAEGQGEPKALDRAGELLRGVVADAQLSAMHGPARQLLEFLNVRGEPLKTLSAAGVALEASQNADDFRRHLDTYEYLMKRFSADTESSSDLIDWVLTMQVGKPDDETAAAATKRWHRSGSLAWLVGAIAHATPSTPNREELLTAGARVDAQSPAYPTVAFHRARVLLLSGSTADTRAVLSDAIARPGLPRASLNALKMVRMATARSLDEFLADAARVPVEEAYGNGGASAGEATLDADAALVLNERLPLAMLRLAAASTSLPMRVRRDILLATFTRAMLLDQTTTVRALLPDVSRQVPALATALKPLASTAGDASPRDEAAILLVGRPGLRPFFAAGRSRTDTLTALDSLRDNWWCSFSSTEWPATPYETPYWHGGLSDPARSIYPDGNTTPSPSFLTADERREAENEWQQLKHLDTAPNEIGRRVLAWARAHPTDPRVPEMLHRIVRAGRYGCTNERSGVISKQAFTLLHRRYSESPWAAKTPLWFK